MKIDPTIIDSPQSRSICNRLRRAKMAIVEAKHSGTEFSLKFAQLNGANLLRQYKRLPRRQQLVAKAA